MIFSDPRVCNAYHDLIINLEILRICKGEGPPYSIKDVNYEVDKKDVLNILEKYFGNKAEEVFNQLLKAGFLIKIDQGYRSLHMDILVRSAMIRTYWPREPYIISPRFNFYFVPLPSREDRAIRPVKGEGISDRLMTALEVFLRDSTLTKIFINIMRDYLSSNGSWGLDYFQATSLINLLLSDKKTHVITAPTGTGKTIVFSLYLLARLLKSRHKGLKEHAVLIYPRKILSVDQAGRIIKLLEICRKYGYEFTFGLRDGTTPRDSRFKEGEGYRGIKCPYCGNELENYKKRGLYTVRCGQCGRIYDFICATREEMGRRPPDILITNMWALETRLIDSEPRDINVLYLSKTRLLIIDEVHEFRSLSAGLVSTLLKIIKHLANPTIILSSATIPSPLDFSSKIVGIDKSNIHHHDFFEYTRGKGIKGKRLVILGLFDINPRYSWSTYVQLWVVMMAFIHYAYLLENRAFVPQAIVFVNNIKELRRINRGYEENISLGEPRDHILGINGMLPPPTDGYMYYHYLTSAKLELIKKNFNSEGRLTELLELVEEMHSLVPSSKRRKVISALKGGKNLAAVLSTSSLELGVDYDNVSFILNAGMENPISMIQRIGRGGRSNSCLKTALGIILTRKIPQESFLLYDISIWEKLNPAPKQLKGILPVASENPQIIKRGLLTASLASMAKRGERTYASGHRINSLSKLKDFLNSIAEELRKEVKVK